MKNRKWLKILLVLLAVVILGVVFTCQANQSSNAETAETKEDTVELVDNESESETVTEGETESVILEQVCVHVCGSVKKPGVYYLTSGSRVFEAVEAAGGLLEDAAGDYVNLAGEVTDGEQIYIPTEKEVEEGDIKAPNSESASSSANAKSELININTASLEELKTLPGIGDTKAQAIISYREKSGNFKSIEEITNVSGIGESSFEKIKEYIKV